MTTHRKAMLKRFVIRWELHFYVAAALIYAAAIPILIIVFPDVSNLWVSILILASGFLNTVAATASAIKSSDTEE